MTQPDERDWYSIPPPPAGWLADLAPRIRGVRFAWSPDLGGATPVGLSSSGLPVGLQVVGPRFAERAILESCQGIEALLAFPAAYVGVMA